MSRCLIEAPQYLYIHVQILSSISTEPESLFVSDEPCSSHSLSTEDLSASTSMCNKETQCPVPACRDRGVQCNIITPFTTSSPLHGYSSESGSEAETEKLESSFFTSEE